MMRKRRGRHALGAAAMLVSLAGVLARSVLPWVPGLLPCILGLLRVPSSARAMSLTCALASAQADVYMRQVAGTDAYLMVLANYRIVASVPDARQVCGVLSSVCRNVDFPALYPWPRGMQV
jgi:hypothetical protein